MSHFKFRLQGLLDLKIETETAARAAVIEKQRQLAEEETALLHALEKEKRCGRHLSQIREQLLTAGADNSVEDIQSKDRYQLALQEDLKLAHEEALVQKFAVEEVETGLKEATAHLLECSREVEKLTKYRAKQETLFLTEVAHREECEQDEIGSVMFANRRADP